MVLLVSEKGGATHLFFVYYEQNVTKVYYLCIYNQTSYHMDTRITNLVVATLRPEDMYKVYVNYLKGTGKPQEFFACTPDGINAIFSSPFEAVYTFLEAETHYDNEMFMRRDDNDRVIFFDEFTPLMVSDVIQWTVKDSWALYEMCSLIDEGDFFYNLGKAYFGKNQTMVDLFMDWTEDNEVTPYDVFEWGFEYFYNKFNESRGIV